MSPLTSTGSDPVTYPLAVVVARSRLASVTVAPVLKANQPAFMVTATCDPTLLPELM